MPGGYVEAAAICGRQSGKDRIGSAIQDFEAMSAVKQLDGTEVYALSIAQDQRSSLRTAFRYASAPFVRPSSQLVMSMAVTLPSRA